MLRTVLRSFCRSAKMPLSLDSKIMLNSGHEIPQLGFGVRYTLHSSEVLRVC